MKKFLSLVLALVMTMSLVTVSAGAKGFTDDSKIQYKEAVDVMSAAKVVDGYSEGDFRPDATLTRGAAAKIICNLILGPTTAAELHADTAPFKDVPVNHTFAGYIAFCAKEGIISGYADGAFRPAATLTSYAFMKMLLGALGYDAEVEQYVGGNWSINVAKRALNIGLDDGLKGDFNGIKSVTREEACLYALNTLTADMVEYDSRTNINVGGAEVVIAGSEAKVMENKGKTDGKVFEKDGEMQFAEMYFDNLSVTKGTDDFARPANVWKNKAEKIGTYADEADATYTAKVEAGDIYKDLDLGSTVDKKDVTVYVNGVEDEDLAVAIKKGSDDKVANSANGVLTEVFYNDDDDTVVITRVDTYVGTIAKTVAAKGGKDAYVVVSPENPAPIGGNENFETNEEFEDDAYVLYTYSESADEIKSVKVAEKVEGTVTRAENADTNNADKKSLTIDGTKYNASAQIAGETLSDVSVKNDYTIYLDSYGYMIYVEEVEEIGDYALILNINNSSDWDRGERAELVFTDGTTKVVDLAKDYYKDGMRENDIVTYKVDEDGDYTLKALSGDVYDADADGNFSLKNDRAGITGLTAGTKNANSATVFVVRDPDDADDWTAYTGIKNAPTIKGHTDSDKEIDVAYYAKGDSSMIKVMFILTSPNTNIEDDGRESLFIAGGSVSNLIHDADGDYFEFNAVVDGELKTVKVADNVKLNGSSMGDSDDVKNGVNGLYKSYSVDKHGIITNLKTYASYTDGENTQVLTGTGIDKVSKEYTVILNTAGTKHTITVDDDAKIYYVNDDDEISESSYKAISVDEDDKIYAVVEDFMVQTLVIEEVNSKDDVQAPTTLTVDASNKTPVVGETVKLTSEIVLNDKKNDEIVGYQWYKDGNKVKGATEATYSFTAGSETDGTYTLKVTVFNDKVDGKDEATFQSTNNVVVASTAAPEAPMTVTVKTYLRDAGGNIPLDETAQTIKEDTTIEAPEYAEYTVTGASSKNVTFVAGGNAVVTFVYNAKAVSKIEVTTAPTSTEVNNGGDFDPAGMVVTATYDNGTTADVTGKVVLSNNTNLTQAGDVTITYTENGKSVTTTVAVTVK